MHLQVHIQDYCVVYFGRDPSGIIKTSLPFLTVCIHSFFHLIYVDTSPHNGELCAYLTGSVPHVFYRSSNRIVHEIFIVDGVPSVRQMQWIQFSPCDSALTGMGGTGYIMDRVRSQL